MIQFSNVTVPTCVSMLFVCKICTFFTWENYKPELFVINIRNLYNRGLPW